VGGISPPFIFKMEKEFNLSEEIRKLFEEDYLDSLADVQGDVSKLIKEFIKIIAELAFKFISDDVERDDFLKEAKKRAGDKLI